LMRAKSSITGATVQILVSRQHAVFCDAYVTEMRRGKQAVSRISMTCGIAPLTPGVMRP
jgi:hypothetical protein